MKKSEFEDKKAKAKKNAMNPSAIQTEAKKLVENLGVEGAKERVERDLTVLITVRESLKVVHNELKDLATEKGNIELLKKLDLANQQLESITGEVL